MKTVFIFIISALLMVGVASSQSGNILSIQTNLSSAGDTNKFIIVMQNIIPINGVQFNIQYDEHLMTILEVEPVNRALTMSSPSSYQYLDNKISILVYDQQANNILADSGAIFEIAFIAKDSLPTDTTTSIEFIEGIAADSAGNVIPFEYKMGSVLITDVENDNNINNHPKQFALYQSYPNPFNPSSIICFDIPVHSVASIYIYNILGQKVNTLIDHKQFQPGSYQEIFNATSYASGVYFYRLEATSVSDPSKAFTHVKKMILLR